MIAIKDMEMPKSCFDCDCCRLINQTTYDSYNRQYMCGIYGHYIVDYYLENTTTQKPKFCPLIEIKEGE